MARFPKIRRPTAEVQQIFNHNYLHLVMGGKLDEVIRSDELANPAYNQPPGTRSIIADYYDGAVKVACVHYYWLPASPGVTWRIGGRSGIPDPKAVLWNGQILIAEERAAD